MKNLIKKFRTLFRKKAIVCTVPENCNRLSKEIVDRADLIDQLIKENPEATIKDYVKVSNHSPFGIAS